MPDNIKKLEEDEDENDIVDTVESDVSEKDKDEEVYDDDSDDSNDLIDNEEKTLDNMVPNISLKRGTERYVVTADGIPQFYTQTIEEANKRMWDIARAFKINVNDYTCYIRECEDLDNIQVIGYYKFYVISYDRILCHFATQKVHEVQEEATEKEECELNNTNNSSYWSTLIGAGKY
jgi:hypothetical protein